MKKLWKQMISMLLVGILLASSAPLAGAAGNIRGESTTISAGNYHTAVIKTDGSLWIWGDNQYGQIGDGTTQNRSTPVKVSDDIATVLLENNRTMAIKTDGSLWSWGNNEDGQLGDGTRINRSTPTKVMDNVVKISMFNTTDSLALKEDGSLWVLSDEQYAQISRGAAENNSVPVKVMDDVVTALSTGCGIAAVKTDGSLWNLGLGYYDGSNLALDSNSAGFSDIPIKIIDSNVASIATGIDHVAILKTDSSLWAWGSNEYGQLGDGTTEDRYVPAKIMENVATVSVSWHHTAAIKTDGSLWTWGYNGCGQLGDGTTIDHSMPVKIMEDVKIAEAGDMYTAAIKTDGSLWTWGNNVSGQLGDGTKEERNIPVKIMDNVATVSAGSSHMVAIKTDGSLWSWGHNYFGQLGDDTNENYRLTPVKIMDGVRVDTTGVTLQPSAPTMPETLPHIYDEADSAENLDFSDILSDVTDQQTAEKAIEDGVSQMTPEQKSSPMGVDKATLLAEEVAACVNVQPLSNGSLNLKRESASAATRTAVTAAEKVLNKNGIETQRVPRAIQTYDAGDNKKISVQNEVLSGDVDQIRVKTSFASATTSAKRANNFTMEDRGNKTVEVKFNTNTDNLVTVSFPGISADDKYMAVVDENGNPVGGKYNPVTGTLEAKLTASGIYRVVNNEKDFADIKSKSKEMQDAIKLLASKGVINGTSETTFAPDSTISRAEIAALLMRTLSLLDPNANGGFTDVTSANWFYGAAGSAKKHNIISGFEDNTFRGLNVIAKNQIVAVAARTLRQQMNYKTPSDITKELSVYGDNSSVESWAREDVALATMCNLVMKRTDGNFGGTANMTRGDAAIIIKRLFDKLW